MIVGADARAVRPYMLCNNQLVHLFTANLSTKIKSDARAVRPYMLYNNQLVYLSTANLSTKIKADARAVRPYLYSLAHQSQPFHRAIWPISPCNMGEIALQNG